MKRILIALMVMITLFSLANAQNQTSAQQGSSNTSTATTVIGVDTTDADAITDAATDSTDADKSNIHTSASFSINANNSNSPFDSMINTLGNQILISTIAIICVFGFPIFALFLIFFFRYKNRKARYRLVEQALAAGQPLPEAFIRESKPTNQRSAGIKNTFTGIGLFIFLWAITDEFEIGTIGLLVMFMGLGQWFAGYKNESKKENKANRSTIDKPTTDDNQ